jgi:hypothetical protein
MTTPSQKKGKAHKSVRWSPSVKSPSQKQQNKPTKQPTARAYSSGNYALKKEAGKLAINLLFSAFLPIRKRQHVNEYRQLFSRFSGQLCSLSPLEKSNQPRNLQVIVELQRAAEQRLVKEARFAKAFTTITIIEYNFLRFVRPMVLDNLLISDSANNNTHAAYREAWREMDTKTGRIYSGNANNMWSNPKTAPVEKDTKAEAVEPEEANKADDKQEANDTNGASLCVIC